MISEKLQNIINAITELQEKKVMYLYHNTNCSHHAVAVPVDTVSFTYDLNTDLEDKESRDGMIMFSICAQNDSYINIHIEGTTIPLEDYELPDCGFVNIEDMKKIFKERMDIDLIEDK